MACTHGAKPERKWENIVVGIGDDVLILGKNGSKKDKKKALARINKAMGRFSGDQAVAHQLVLAQMNSSRDFERR